MRNRIFFHALHFLALCLFIFLSVAIYYRFSYVSFAYSLKMSLQFIQDRSFNFILVAAITYFLTYVTGFLKYTIEDKYFSMVRYLKEIMKLLLILVMANFIEFFVFYQARIGRLIYVILFVLVSIYYLIYLRLRLRTGSRGLLWLAAAPAKDILARYMKKDNSFFVIQTERERERAGLNASVVYQDGHINEETSEALIKNKLAGYTVVELVELIEKESGKIPLDYVNIHWFLQKFDVIDRNFFRTNRFFNIFMSLLLLIIFFPLGFLFALIHKIFSKGSIFFIQQRQGLHGRIFKLIKFRTMVSGAEKNGATFTGEDDPRVTRVGNIMRRMRIDEIPQFFNVLKGDMSLVGPRPERKVFIETLGKQIPYYSLRLLVPPGITGWAQVNGAYAGSNIEEHKEKLEYDLFYIKNRNIFLDWSILLRTIKTILMAKGK